MESSAGFDVVGVVARVAVLDPSAASMTELLWADRAADRVRGWLDEWQARVHVEMTVPRPSRPGDPTSDGTSTDGAPAGGSGAGPDDHGGGAGAPEGHEDAPSTGGGGAEASGESLPSLGDARPSESLRDRERKQRRAQLLADLPAMAELLRAGRISTGHVDVLAMALSRVPDAIRHRVIDDAAALLQIAAGSNPDRFARAVQQAITVAYDREGIERLGRQRARCGLRRGIDAVSGMHWLHGELDPERGAELFARLDAEREAIYHSGAAANMTRDQAELQALLNLLATPDTHTARSARGADAGTGQRSSPTKGHVSILIDIETLTIGAHERIVCETSFGRPLPVEIARAIACSAQVSYGFTIGGRVVHHLANTSLATTDQRRQLRMMHRSCIGPDCDVPFEHCQIHHIIPRSRHGPTTIPLLTPLCGNHHDDIHHRGWTLHIADDRTITWTPPTGDAIIVAFTGLASDHQPTLFPTDPNTAA